MRSWWNLDKKKKNKWWNIERIKFSTSSILIKNHAIRPKTLYRHAAFTPLTINRIALNLKRQFLPFTAFFHEVGLAWGWCPFLSIKHVIESLHSFVPFQFANALLLPCVFVLLEFHYMPPPNDTNCPIYRL